MVVKKKRKISKKYKIAVVSGIVIMSVVMSRAFMGSSITGFVTNVLG